MSKNDAIIYLYLSKNGENKLSTIAQECGVPRSQVYDALTRLIDRGYVSKELTSKQPRYTSMSTDLLIEHLKFETKKQLNDINNLENTFKNLMLDEKRERKIYFTDNPDNCQTNLETYIKKAESSIQGFFVISDSMNTYFMNNIFPLKVILEKSKKISKISLIINEAGIKASILKELSQKNIEVSFWKGLKDIPTFILLIDNRFLIVNSFSTEESKITYLQSLVFENIPEYMKVFNYLLTVFKLYNKNPKSFVNNNRNDKIDNNTTTDEQKEIIY